MAKQNKFIVDAEEAEQRLDIFLSGKLEISRSQAQKLIEEKLVAVNGKEPKKAGDTIKEGYEIVVNNAKRLEAKKVEMKKEAETVFTEPKIVAKTDDYIVVEKPTGLLTHPTMADEKNSLSGWLVKKYPEIKKVGDDPELRPGIVHRLDKEASGLLVVARTQKMFDHLKEQFKNRTIEKEYYALVHDQVARDWEILNFPIARSETSDRMAARPIRADEIIEEGEKDAKTEFMVEKRFVNFTLLRVTLHTGRMHQIRVHFLAYNHPLVGDPLYIQKKRKRAWDDKLGRLFLHSTKLSFTDLNGEKQNFESPMPPELNKFLEQLS
jgi:23S rRNA pseudouridine1911/1915/1917 synthase